MRLLVVLLGTGLLCACGAQADSQIEPRAHASCPDPEDGGPQDAQPQDAETLDAATQDVQTPDAQTPDAQPQDAHPPDAQSQDAQTPDATPTNPLASLNDEFNDPATLANWQRLHQVEGRPAQYTTLDINATRSGHLVIVPTQSGWYQDSDAPFLFKSVSGNFTSVMRVRASSLASDTTPSNRAYSSAGFLARDPASADGGNENWLMWNRGYQSHGVGVGTEGKTTVNSGSTLYLDSEAHSGLLALCRIGSTFRMYSRPDGQSSWTLVHTFNRPDLPNTLQVGMIVNAWQGPVNVRAAYDWIRFAVPSQPSDCTSIINTN